MAEKMKSGETSGEGPEYQRDHFSGWRTVGIIVALLVLWAAILSIGAVFNGNDGNHFGRPVFIVAAVAVFCSGWIIALVVRQSKHPD